MLSSTSESVRTSQLLRSPARVAPFTPSRLTPHRVEPDEIEVEMMNPTEENNTEIQEKKTTNTSPSKHWCTSPHQFLLEILYVFRLQLPIMSTYASDFLVIVVQMYFAGKMGATSLAAVSLGASFCNVFGFSLGVGMLSAFDILSAQAYGANELRRIGVALHQTLVAMLLLALVVLPLWWFSEPLLLLLGQDSEVSALSGSYIRVTWIALLPGLIYSTLRRYMQNQGIVLPSTVAGITNILINILAIWLLADHTEIGFLAFPLARIISTMSSAILMTLYITVPGLHRPTWMPFSWRYLKGLGRWAKLAAPGTFMVCSEWWGMEVFAFLAGLFGAESLAAMALLYNIYTFFAAVPISFTVVATALTGNAVGAGDIPCAKFRWRLVMALATITQTSFFIVLYLTKSIWPSFFTSDQVVLDLVDQSVLFFCLFSVFDTMQATLNGAIRGAGRLVVGAISYIIGYYVIGMGLGLPYAFLVDESVRGLWAGLVIATVTCLVVLSIYIFFLNWNNAVAEAQKRLEEGRADLPPESWEESESNDASDSATSTDMEEMEQFSPELSEEDLTSTI